VISVPKERRWSNLFRYFGHDNHIIISVVASMAMPPHIWISLRNQAQENFITSAPSTEALGFSGSVALSQKALFYLREDELCFDIPT
jgi:hypothetical protein